MSLTTLISFFCLFVPLFKLNAQQKYCNEYSTFKPRVILIGIDGVNPTLITENEVNLKWLIENGASTMKARSTIEAWSAPGWTQILCSMSDVLTGVVSNYWLPPWAGFGAQNITPITGQDTPFPCVFQVIKQQNPNITTLYYYDWIWLQILGNQGMGPWIDYEYYPGNNFKDDLIAENFTNLIENCSLPNFSVVYFGEVDSYGHLYGWGSTEYQQKLTQTDQRVGQILDSLRNHQILEDVYIGVVSDHGAVPGAFNHGEQNDDNLFVPYIVYGPGIKKNYTLQSPVITYDLIPNLLGTISLKAHPLWQGNLHNEIWEC